MKRAVHAATVEQSPFTSAMRAQCLVTGAVSLFAVAEEIRGVPQWQRALGYFHHSCSNATHVMAHDIAATPKGGRR